MPAGANGGGTGDFASRDSYLPLMVDTTSPWTGRSAAPCYLRKGDRLMGPFARKYGKRTGSEARTFVYLSATSFGISVLLLLVGPG